LSKKSQILEFAHFVIAIWNAYLHVWCFKKVLLKPCHFVQYKNSRLTKSKIKSLINFKFSFMVFVAALFEIKKEMRK
jgi:hypothetical protein